jgi:hypothetical protein
MTGCPACGADRLKGAPLPLVSAVVFPLIRRYRYRCSSCRWSGWKRRLKSRGEIHSGTIRHRSNKDVRAVSFAIALVLFLVSVSVLLVRSCERTQGPIEITPTGGVMTPTLELVHL